MSRTTILKSAGGFLCILICGSLLAFALAPARFLYRIASVVGIPNQIEPLPSMSPKFVVRDDYYVIEQIDSQTYAIGEPRYWQKNVSYLLLGETHALLFDSGPGVRDVTQVIEKLTSLPVIVTASHLHYDHVSALGQFGETALVDLPQLRGQTDPDAVFIFAGDQHLGAFEHIQAKRIKIQRWLKPDSEIDLGGRVLKVFATPGHTDDSMMLFDTDRHQIFAGDFIYPGFLVAFLPGAHMGKYLTTTNRLLLSLPHDTIIFSGHAAPESKFWQTPRLTYQDLVDLKSTIAAIRDHNAVSEALFPRQFPVNRQIAIMTPFSWNMNWTEP